MGNQGFSGAFKGVAIQGCSRRFEGGFKAQECIRGFKMFHRIYGEIQEFSKGFKCISGEFQEI